MGSYVTVSTKVEREVVEKAKRLGINVSEFLRRKLEEEFERREIELITRRLSELSNVLDAIGIERVMRHVREDRES
jgi:predicted fused transcriptional regulator/phosphomethylpyrimidine kinase